MEAPVGVNAAVEHVFLRGEEVVTEICLENLSEAAVRFIISSLRGRIVRDVVVKDENSHEVSVPLRLSLRVVEINVLADSEDSI